MIAAARYVQGDCAAATTLPNGGLELSTSGRRGTGLGSSAQVTMRTIWLSVGESTVAVVAGAGTCD